MLIKVVVTTRNPKYAICTRSYECISHINHFTTCFLVLEYVVPVRLNYNNYNICPAATLFDGKLHAYHSYDNMYKTTCDGYLSKFVYLNHLIYSMEALKVSPQSHVSGNNP